MHTFGVYTQWFPSSQIRQPQSNALCIRWMLLPNLKDICTSAPPRFGSTTSEDTVYQLRCGIIPAGCGTLVGARLPLILRLPALGAIVPRQPAKTSYLFAPCTNHNPVELDLGPAGRNALDPEVRVGHPDQLCEIIPPLGPRGPLALQWSVKSIPRNHAFLSRKVRDSGHIKWHKPCHLTWFYVKVPGQPETGFRDMVKSVSTSQQCAFFIRRGKSVVHLFSKF